MIARFLNYDVKEFMRKDTGPEPEKTAEQIGQELGNSIMSGLFRSQ